MLDNLVLASGSPRRKELLSQLGLDFSIITSDIEEQQQQGEAAEDYVQRLSVEKAQAVLALQPSAVVLGADTVVVSKGKVLEKPTSFAHFNEMMQQLSGSEHQVLTAVSVVSKDKVATRLVTTLVCFKALSEQDIRDYWQTGEPQDKAGGYGIQGIGGRFVTRIEGSYHAVVGLPLYETELLLAQF